MIDQQRGLGRSRGLAACWLVGITLAGTTLAGSACQSAQQPPAQPTSGSSALAATERAPAPAATAAPRVQKDILGELEGKPVERYTLTNQHGLSLRVITYGATITELHVPDRAGKLGDIVLGFDRLEDYAKFSPYFGATVGRVANRIANARFELDGKKYELAANNAPHHLHGGKKGWDKQIWSAEPVTVPNGAALRLSYVSKDGEEGYPGTVTATTQYTLTDSDDLEVAMHATTDRTTLLNMAHHSYWNLAGHASGPITEQVLQLSASQYTPSAGLVPNGRVSPVAGTPFDFTQPKAIGKDLEAAGGQPLGFDHNWVVDGDPHQLRRVARLHDPESGRVMTIDANQPGVQFYTGNFLDGTAVGKGGVAYAQYTGLCLETQKFPNSINVPVWRKEVILKPGEAYDHLMVHHFSVE